MTVPVSSTFETPVTSEANLAKEEKTFSELFRRLVNAVINQIFDLQPQRAVQRMQYLVFLFLLSVFLVTLMHREYSLRVWAEQFQKIFNYVLSPDYAARDEANAFVEVFNFAVRAFTDPHTVQYIPIFLAAFFIALQCAAIYLADIFELEINVGAGIGIKVARDFIWEVALTGSDETIRIQQGEISEENRLSTNYLIGGPGKVIVDLDSVALFEKPDGTPHVIGPTGREPRGRATLDGFERFRQAIDIRDQYVDLRDQDPRSQSVKGRSLDGLPITATDVRLMFSVYRGENPKKTDQYPYPFSEEAIKHIVYKSPSEVTYGQFNPSKYMFAWINNLTGSIRGQLGAFISQHKLSDFLASIGMPEFERSKQREEAIAQEVTRLTQQADEANKAIEIIPPPEFTPRYKIKNLFTKFAEDFTQKTRDKGVELHWIGLGTWKTPPEIHVVPEKHLEAWILTQENLEKGSGEAMKKAEKEAMLEKLENLIQTVPLDIYEEINDLGNQSGMFSKRDSKKKDSGKKTGSLSLDEQSPEDDANDILSSIALLNSLKNRRSHSSEYYNLDHESAMKLLLREYRKQLVEAVEFMKARNETVPPKINEAINYIEEQAGWSHWAGH